MILTTEAEKDKRLLKAEEFDILESKVLPTARRWLGIHGLAKHGAGTLAYWGEPIEVPDEICDYRGNRTTRSEVLTALHYREGEAE